MTKKNNSVKEEKIAKFGPAFNKMSELLHEGKIPVLDGDAVVGNKCKMDTSILTKDVFYVRDYSYDDCDEPYVCFVGPFKVLRPFDNVCVMSSYMNAKHTYESFLDFLVKNGFVEKMDAQELSINFYSHDGNQMNLEVDNTALTYTKKPKGNDLFVLLDKQKLESALSNGLNCSEEPLLGYNTTGTYYEDQMQNRMKKKSGLVKILCKNISSTFYRNDNLYIISDIRPEDISVAS